jgi:hypothetical protein
MSDTSGSLARHAATAACLFMLSVNAHAQSKEAPTSGPDFFTRYDFHLSAKRLIVDDEQFSWDTDFGGEIDIVDYGKGSVSGIANYEGILGDEFRPFDPNQSYYALQVSMSYRLPKAELTGVFHHVSRHLIDRPKPFPIAWNVAGARVSGRIAARGLTMDARAQAGGVVERANVDYKWTGDLDLVVRRMLNSHVGVFAHGFGELIGVNGTIGSRGTQTGGLIEAGVRFDGRAGAVELFAGYEHRIDADPVNLESRSWGLAGFRLVGK